ncbi:GNAT family N-acetyltransferase ['Paenibacillus yunnanensis' Narsing Rao et al. 2020]|uniref:GNAT family N-acetyltransferase n=1 Tax=Paenibacillus tengchongensis TaxID=2608684 RepID=UPI00124C0A27|nr:GNAT family N-acetyltransferase [Paenibacillus tengchongensis]
MLILLNNYWDKESMKRLLAECMTADDAEIEKELEQYAAEESGKLLGLFIAGELAAIVGIRADGGEMEIRHLAVQAKWRGKGIGSSIIEELLRCPGITALRAETDRKAAGFYRRAGFAVVSLGDEYSGVERYDCILAIADEAISC